MTILFLRYGGLILIFISLVLARSYQQIKTRGEACKAVVVAHKNRIVRTGKQVYTLYIPIIEYQIKNKIYRKEGPSSQGKNIYHLGQTLMIQINPQKPEKFIVPGKNHDLLNIICIFGAGFMLVILSFAR